MPTKVFILGGYEVGFTLDGRSGYVELVADGAKLDYFDAGHTRVANNKRIAYLSDAVTGWWLRTSNDGCYSEGLVHGTGSIDSYSSSTNIDSYGVRPALILPRDMKLNVKSVEEEASNIITFTVSFEDGTTGTFEAEEGMTWGKFVTSEYNTNNFGFTVYNSGFLVCSEGSTYYTLWDASGQVGCYSGDTIVSGATYFMNF